VKHRFWFMLTLPFYFLSCMDNPTETKLGEVCKITVSAKIGAIYLIAPQGDVKFYKIETETSNDTTEIKTVYSLNRIEKDSVAIQITKDSKRILGKIYREDNSLIKEFIMDNGAETRIVKF